MSKWTDMARKAAQKAADYASSEEAKAHLQQAQRLASSAGAKTLDLSKQGANLTAQTAQRTYTGLRGFKDARAATEDAKTRYDEALADFQTHVDSTRQRAATFEARQRLVMGTSVARFIELWERHKKAVQLQERDFQVQLHLTPDAVQAFEATRVTTLELGTGLAGAAAAGAGVGATAVTAATMLGTASTGVALSSLSGAAAHSALLAWFGGGSLAAGGGGMALGTAVVGGLFVAPAVLVGAVVAARKGHQNLTQAQEFTAQVDVAIESMHLRTAGFAAVRQRMDELEMVIDELDRRLLAQVQVCEDLERRGQTSGSHAADFTAAIFPAYSTCVTLSQVLRVPVVDEDFAVTATSADVLERARQRLGGDA